MRIFIGSDHAGFDLKEKVKRYLEIKRIEYEDLGAKKYEKKDDYPDYAFKVAEKVVNEKNRDSLGILICGTGTGMSISANKAHGARAATVYDSYSAKMSRLHNNANILCLRGKAFPFNKIKKILDIWLRTEFSSDERHKRRLKKIEKYENKRLK